MSDARLVVDIASAAAKAAAESIVIKCNTLPLHLRTPTMAIALHLLAAKSAALQRAIPSIAAIVGTLPEDLYSREEAELRKQAAPFL
jgi:aspartate/glutamate racemase